MLEITEETTRFVFKDYTDAELSTLRRLIAADGESFLYEDEEYVACPIGVENYIKKKFPHATIKKQSPWPAANMKYIPKEFPSPRNKLQRDALKFMREYKAREQIGLICGVGTGKSYMAANHAITCGKKTLIICPTTEILSQWIKTLTDMFKIPQNRILHINGTPKLSMIGGDYDWVLVLEQTLQTLVQKHTLEETLKKGKFGTKIIDEIHMFLRNNIAIECCSNIAHSLYLTGTFFRTAEEESNLFSAVYHGMLRFEVVDQDELERYGQQKHIQLYSVVINSKLTKSEVREFPKN